MSPDAVAALSKTNFTTLDWGIVVVYILVSVVSGILVTRFAKDMASYLGAGRSLGTALGVATMTGTELGLITVMYNAEKGFAGGFAALHIAVIAGVVTLGVGLTGFIVADLRRHRVLTIPEFYQRRYNRTVRVVGGAMLAVAGILNMGLFLKISSIFIVGITGLSSTGWAVPTVTAVSLALVLVYTVLGGMVSVIITDYIQFVVLAFGLIAATLLAVNHVGWDHIFETVSSQMGPQGFDPLLADSAFGIEYVVWMGFIGLVSCAIWPTAVARALAMESPQAVKRQYAWSSLSFTIRFAIPMFWGVCAFVFIMTAAPDLREIFFPAEGEAALSSLYATPIFLGRVLPAGLIGLITAAMIAAFMSTHDSYLLCWSSVITQDVVAPLREGEMSTADRIRLTRVLIVAIGVFTGVWGFVYTGSEHIWEYMTITGAIYAIGAMPLLVGGLYWKRASSTGALCALATGCSALFGLNPVYSNIARILGGSVENWVQATPTSRISAQIGIAAVCLTVTVFVVASLLFPDKESSPIAPGELA